MISNQQYTLSRTVITWNFHKVEPFLLVLAFACLDVIFIRINEILDKYSLLSLSGTLRGPRISVPVRNEG